MAAYIAFYVVTSAVYLLFGIPMLNMLLNIAGMILLNRLYEKTLKRNIMMVLVTYVAMILAELAAVWASGFVPSGIWERQQESLSQMGMIIQCVMLSLIVQVLKRFKGVARSTEGDWVCWAGVILMQIMLIGLIATQAEHGIDSQVIFITNSEAKLNEVQAEVDRQLQLLSRKDMAAKALDNSRMVLVNSVDDMINLSNLYAPEHLILQVKDYSHHLLNSHFLLHVS